MDSELEMVKGARERRAFDGSVELRDAGSGKLGYRGWACLTNVENEIGIIARSGFVEVVRPGAFASALRALELGNGRDVVLLINHAGDPLARTGAGTLRLSEDSRGLKVDADLDPDDPDVQRLQRKYAHGSFDGQMSFSFRVPEGGDSWSKDGKHREITRCEIAGGDVGPVTHAASPTTSSELVARAAAEAARRPLPNYGRRHRERLASMRGTSSLVVDVTASVEVDPGRFRRRLDELRGL
jgi:uncharacterized protein